MRATERQESTSLDPSASHQRSWRGLRRIQIEIAVFAILLAMGAEAISLGPIRDALIKHHDGAAHDLEWVAEHQDGSMKGQERARAYRRLARWYRWQAWRYRLPLFASVSRHESLDPDQIDTREFIKKIGYLERIEWALPAEDSTPHP